MLIVPDKNKDTIPNNKNNPKKLNVSLLNQQQKLEIGSGNLSIRKKSRMLQICSLLNQRRFKKLLEQNDDIVISSFLASPMLKSVKLPNRNDANKFSSEFSYLPGSIGGFRPWLSFDHSVLTRIATDCSDFKELFMTYLYEWLFFLPFVHSSFRSVFLSSSLSFLWTRTLYGILIYVIITSLITCLTPTITLIPTKAPKNAKNDQDFRI